MILGGWGARKSGFGEGKRVSDWERVGVGEERENGGEREKTVPFGDGLLMSAFDAQGIARPAGRACVFCLVDSRVGHRESKGGFRSLRRAASLRGWIAPGRRPGPACRLRAGGVRP